MQQIGMESEIKISILDFMNLVFGRSEETTEFWQGVLLPYASSYFNY